MPAPEAAVRTRRSARWCPARPSTSPSYSGDGFGNALWLKSGSTSLLPEVSLQAGVLPESRLCNYLEHDTPIRAPQRHGVAAVGRQSLFSLKTLGVSRAFIQPGA